MTLQDILARLQGARPSGSGWAAHCPAHSDGKTSLSIGQGDDGRVLIKCFAGCPTGQIVEALGLKMADLFTPQPATPRGRRKPQQTRYEVRNVTDGLVAIHVREDGAAEGKRMWWERPGGDKGLDGTPVSALPLYRTETLLALTDGALVVVTEGEKAADALAGAGVTAVATVTGANAKPGDDALTPLLRFQVFLWPDADPPGQAHMLRTAARLWAMGHRDVSLVDWPGAPPKGDAADALTQGADVQAVIQAARPWQPAGVDLVALLEEVTAFVQRYVVLTDHQARAVALWVVHTHVIEAAECTPYLWVHSPEKRSGKTRLLETLAQLVARPWLTGRVTSAVLIRRVDRDLPKLLLDETDAVFKGGQGLL